MCSCALLCVPWLPVQVWNMNSATGIVGVFNLQGASWDRSRRRFHIHDASPPELTGGWVGGWVAGRVTPPARPLLVHVLRAQASCACFGLEGLVGRLAACSWSAF